MTILGIANLCAKYCTWRSECAPDFFDLDKFSRYYRFEGVDIVRLCDEIVDVITAAQENGALERVITSLGKGRPTVSAAVAIDMLRNKMANALAQMISAKMVLYVSNADWKGIVQRHRHIWANSQLRSVMRPIYPFALPIVQATRKARINHYIRRYRAALRSWAQF